MKCNNYKNISVHKYFLKCDKNAFEITRKEGELIKDNVCFIISLKVLWFSMHKNSIQGLLFIKKGLNSFIFFVLKYHRKKSNMLTNMLKIDIYNKEAEFFCHYPSIFFEFSLYINMNLFLAITLFTIFLVMHE